MKKITATHIKTTNPTSNDTISAGYNVGQWWRNTVSGALFYHKTDGVWLAYGSGGGGIAGVKVNTVELTPDEENKVNVTVPTQPSDIGAQAALGFTPENTANKNTANGYAGLNASSQIALSQTPIGKILSNTTYEGTWYNATADPDTDVITCADIAFENNMAVEIRANTGTRPGGLAEYTTTYWGTYYNVRDASGNTCKLTSTVDGTALDITSAGVAGWQIRVCPLFVDVAIPNLSDYKNVQCLIFAQFAKKTTTATGVIARINNDSNSTNYNGTINASSLLPAIELYIANVIGTNKYQLGVLDFYLSRETASSCFVSVNAKIKTRADNTAMTAATVITQTAGSEENYIIGLANEVTSIRVTPANTDKSAIRSLKVVIYQA